MVASCDGLNGGRTSSDEAVVEVPSDVVVVVPSDTLVASSEVDLQKTLDCPSVAEVVDEKTTLVVVVARN